MNTSMQSSSGEKVSPATPCTVSLLPNPVTLCSLANYAGREQGGDEELDLEAPKAAKPKAAIPRKVGSGA